MQDEVRSQESILFNQMIRQEGFRLSYEQLRSLRPELKEDYFKATFENDLEITKYANEVAKQTEEQAQHTR